MKNKLIFWTIAVSYTIITWPFVAIGFVYDAAQEEFKNGRRKHRLFTYWINKLWKKINSNYYKS